ncbi:MAG: 50S ribosomal protein L10 [Nanoarchaeota archaeon]
MKKQSPKERIKPVPEFKKAQVDEILKKLKHSRTILVASTKGLPASQFQKIKSDLRGRADIMVIKKSILLRAITLSEKGMLQQFKEKVKSDCALIFSDIDTFELSALLTESQSSTKAKAGDIAPEDINVESGPTELIPGPAISELSSVGLKVAVEGGKLAVKIGATIVKKGEAIKENVASVMSKLKINPMKVGFIPLFSYDSKSDMVYEEIKIDKKGVFDELKHSISKSLGFAIHLGYATKETISFLISKASMHEKVLESKINASGGSENASS